MPNRLSNGQFDGSSTSTNPNSTGGSAAASSTAAMSNSADKTEHRVHLQSAQIVATGQGEVEKLWGCFYEMGIYEEWARNGHLTCQRVANATRTIWLVARKASSPGIPTISTTWEDFE